MLFGYALTVKAKIWLSIGLLVAIVLGAGLIKYKVDNSVKPNQSNNSSQNNSETSGVPQLKTEAIVEGLTNPWDIAFTPDGTMLFTERPGLVSVFKDGQPKLVDRIDDVMAKGEGGLLGLAVDPDFATNRFIYTCYNSNQKSLDDARLVRWKVADDYSDLSDRKDIVAGIPANSSGRHSGCRPRFGPDGYLWVGTGDAAIGENSQDPSGLGGKILRIDRDGNAAPGNVGSGFDARIYSYGHRNTQGLAFDFANSDNTLESIRGFSVEHGPDRDDEINPLFPGNFGWDPVPGTYNEAVPMTDKTKFPDAITELWKSGSPPKAPSGAVVLSGKQWKDWDGALIVAFLRAKQAGVFVFDKDNKLQSETEVLKDFGRLRSVAQGPDGNLYISTDNGDAKDKIIRATPQ